MACNSIRGSRGVHLVGSVRLPGEPEDPLSQPPPLRTIFRGISEALPTRLRRLPDGETGKRHHFVNWQRDVFLSCPWILNDRERSTELDLVPKDADTRVIELGSTAYDDYAISSFDEFIALQRQGVIASNVRFQVCIPTPVNVLTRFVHSEYQAEVEPKYEEILCQAIQNIQSFIPRHKLAIQIDCAVEFAILEGIAGPGGAFRPWFEPSAQAIVDRILRLARLVHKDVQLGFHLCYGDLGHRHFVDPKDTAKLVNVANMISDQLVHPVDFIHMPVPKNRQDAEYYAPLKQLHLATTTDVYLGLVHPHDLEGTKKRIESAQTAIREFGIATECGWGRTSVQDISSILDILKTASEPL